MGKSGSHAKPRSDAPKQPPEELLRPAVPKDSAENAQVEQKIKVRAPRRAAAIWTDKVPLTRPERTQACPPGPQFLPLHVVPLAARACAHHCQLTNDVLN